MQNFRRLGPVVAEIWCNEEIIRGKIEREKIDREIPILDQKMVIFKQSQKSNQIEFRHAVNGILFLVTSLFEWYNIQVLYTMGKIIFEAAKTGNSRSISIAHSLRAALFLGGAAPAVAGAGHMVMLTCFSDKIFNLSWHTGNLERFAYLTIFFLFFFSF